MAQLQGSQLASWGDFCVEQTGNTCVVDLSQATYVTAEFSLIPEPISVSLTGNGTGTVYGQSGSTASASSSEPIDCEDTPASSATNCSISYDYGTLVTLLAVPDADMQFNGWSGACSGASTTCTVTLDQARDAVADFEPVIESLQVSVTGAGQGVVTSGDGKIDCGNSQTACSENIDEGATATLTATAASGWVFERWTSGPCTGSMSSACQFTSSGPTTATADFEYPQTLTVTVNGTGTVSSQDFSIDCGNGETSCSAGYAAGTQVNLTANFEQMTLVTVASDANSTGSATVESYQSPDLPQQTITAGQSVSGYFPTGATVIIVVVGDASSGISWTTGPCASTFAFLQQATCNFTASGSSMSLAADVLN